MNNFYVFIDIECFHAIFSYLSVDFVLDNPAQLKSLIEENNNIVRQKTSDSSSSVEENSESSKNILCISDFIFNLIR